RNLKRQRVLFVRVSARHSPRRSIKMGCASSKGKVSALQPCIACKEREIASAAPKEATATGAQLSEEETLLLPPVQEEGVMVLVRFRPLNEREKEGEGWIEVNGERNEVRVLKGGTGKMNETKTFAFDAVLPPSCGQQRIFDLAAPPIVSKALQGFNATMFAFGQTGSGKTHTMEGLPSDPGLIPRLCDELFRQVESRRETHIFRMRASYIEIYNEHINDLLDGR
ncbi:unnamed protein product, partial [Phaeothamnion confervicola]